MNSILSVANFIKNCFQTIINLLKVLVMSKWKLGVSNLSKKDFILLANGPSLQADIDKFEGIFKDSNLVMVNSSCLSESFSNLKPSYYILLDPYFFHEENLLPSVERTHEVFLSAITWEMTLYVPYNSRNSSFIQNIKIKAPNIDVIFFNNVVTKGGFDKINHFLYNKGLAIPQSQNVIVFCTFFLANKNANKVYLFGAENNWHVTVEVDKDNFLILRDEHFYHENEEDKVVKLYQDVEETQPTKMSDLMMSSYKVFIGYENVARFAQTKKCKIYNCSKNSLIDSFERMDDETFMRQYK